MTQNGSNRLPVLATEINDACGRARVAMKRSLAHAIEAGDYLLEAKEQVSHGDWLKDAGLFAMAGLWERAEQVPGGPVESFTIVTVAANALVTKYHPKARMPAILNPADLQAWLDPTTPMETAKSLLTAYPDDGMAARPAKVERQSPRIWLPQADSSVPSPRLWLQRSSVSCCYNLERHSLTHGAALPLVI